VVVATVGMTAATAAEVPRARVAELEVSLWPEYDRPAMLVILRARLPSGIELPATVTLPMPAGIETPHAVARRQAGGVLVVATYTREVQGPWAWIAIATDTADVQLEYYQDLGRAGDERSYAFEWPGGVRVDRLSFEVQTPPRAAAVRILPPPGEKEGEDGRRIHRATLGAMREDQATTVTLAYQVGGAELRRASEDVPVARVEGGASRADGPGSPWVFAALGAAFALLVVSLVSFVRRGAKRAQ